MIFEFYASNYIKKRLVTVATLYNKNGQFGTLRPLSAPGLKKKEHSFGFAKSNFAHFVRKKNF